MFASKTGKILPVRWSLISSLRFIGDGDSSVYSTLIQGGVVRDGISRSLSVHVNATVRH